MAVTGSARVTIDAGSDATGDDAPSSPEVGADASVDDDGTSASDAASENDQSEALDAGEEG
jgi:hypothetical protein